MAEFALAEILGLQGMSNVQLVHGLIKQKLLAGGYGQSTEQKLNLLLPSDTSAETRVYSTSC